MSFIIFLEMKTERQLIVVPTWYLSKPPVILQQVKPAAFGLCFESIKRCSQSYRLPIAQIWNIAISSQNTDAAVQINFCETECLTGKALQGSKH